MGAGLELQVLLALHLLTFAVSQIGHEDEAESDIFSIKEVSFQTTGDSEWRDTNYTLNTDSLDWVSAG